MRSRRKTLSLSVNRAGEAVVRAPICADENAISRFLSRHERWLNRRIAEANAHVLNLTDGETVVLYGEEYRILSGRPALKEGAIYLPREGREESFITLIKKLALRNMTAYTERVAAQFGFRYSGVRISSARGRWGACSRNGGISYTFRTAFLPLEIVNYIVVHELCHTRFFNHSAAFWREVGRILPYYATHRKALKSCGYIMNYL